MTERPSGVYMPDNRTGLLIKGNKIAVLGCPGSGKSTFAVRLHELTGIPVFHLDNLWWRADGTHIPRDEFDVGLKALTDKAEWIIDGDYSRTYEARISVCEVVIFLDYDEETCMKGIKNRVGKKRADMPWTESTLDPELVAAVKKYRAENRPVLYGLLDKYPDKQGIILRSRKEAEDLLILLSKSAEIRRSIGKMDENKLFTIRYDPDPDVLVKPYNEALQIDSCGDIVFGRVLHPEFNDEKSLSPAVLMLHGQPGGDKNMDLAEWFRSNGFTVMVFSYRGVWGSHGYYCLSHNIEDAKNVAAYIRAYSKEWRVDPERLFVFGHSMGGFTAMNAMASGLKVKGAVLMAPCDMGYDFLFDRPTFDTRVSGRGKVHYTMPNEDYMKEDAEKHAAGWHFPGLLPRLDKKIAYRFIGGRDDTTTPPAKHILPVLTAMKENGFNVDYTELPDGHMFPLNRVKLAITALGYLKEADSL